MKHACIQWVSVTHPHTHAHTHRDTHAHTHKHAPPSHTETLTHTHRHTNMPPHTHTNMPPHTCKLVTDECLVESDTFTVGESGSEPCSRQAPCSPQHCYWGGVFWYVASSECLTTPTAYTVMASPMHAGHGFKLAPVMGKILSELALDLPPSYDLSPFKLARFNVLKSSLWECWRFNIPYTIYLYVV